MLKNNAQNSFHSFADDYALNAVASKVENELAIENANIQLKKVTDDLQQSKCALFRANQENGRLKTQLNQVTNQRNGLRNQLQIVTTERSDLRTQVEKLQTQIGKLNR